MPTYEYRCENGHSFEVMQRMSDDPLTTCEQCGALVERVFHPVAVHFKGSGFYTTDYGSGKAAANSSDGEKSEASDSGGDSSESKKDAKKDSTDGKKSKAGSGSD